MKKRTTRPFFSRPPMGYYDLPEKERKAFEALPIEGEDTKPTE